MAVYLFDDSQKLIKIVANEAIKESIQTQELPDDGSLLKDKYKVSIKNDGRLENAQYMAIKSYEGNAQEFDFYRVINRRTEANWTELQGVQAAYFELSGHVVKERRPTDAPTGWFITSILSGTDWRLGYSDIDIPKLTTHIYFLSVKDALAKIQSTIGVEMMFKVEISGSKITDKWVEVYNKLGNETLKRFNYGTNALTVVKETSHQELYTALIGRGKGEEVSSAEENQSGQAGYGRKINFEDVEWSVANGDPLDKPAGQLYLEYPQATQEFGIQTISGQKLPRVGIVEFNDTEDPNLLIQQTYEALEYYARPKVLFKADVLNIGNTGIGDTVTIHRHDLNIHYKTRVRKVERDKKNNNRTKVELGDVIHNSSTQKQKQFSSNLNNLQDQLETLKQEQRVTSIEARNGVTANYTNDEPQRKKTGDLWYRDHPSLAGETQLLMWDGNAWELIRDTSVTDEVKKQVDEATQKSENAISRADEINAEMRNAVNNAGFTSLDSLFLNHTQGLRDVNSRIENLNREMEDTVRRLENNFQTDIVKMSNDIRSASERADELREWADNLEIGGVNLLRGTSDELKQFTKFNGEWDWNYQSLSRSDLDNHRITVGTKLTLRVYIYQPSQRAAAFIQFTSKDLVYKQYYGNWIEAGQSGWSTVTMTVSNEDLANFRNMTAAIRGGSNNNTQTVHISHKKLEIGSIPTDWDYNPEEAFLEIDKTNEALSLKANQKSLDLATRQIEENALKVDLTAQKLDLKADKTVVDELNNRVMDNSMQIQVNAKEISKRLTGVEVDQKISGLAHTTYVDNQVKNTADSFEQKLSSYALQSQLDGLATVSGTQTLINRTAESLSDTIATVEGKIPNNYENRNLILNSELPEFNDSYRGANSGLAKKINNDYISITPINEGNAYTTSMEYTEDPVLGEFYTFSIDIATYSEIGVYVYYNFNTSYTGGTVPNTNGEWVRHTFTFKKDRETTLAHGLIGFHNLQPGKEIKYRKLKLEKGTKATPWVLAQEELVQVTAFNDLERTVEETKSTIASANGDISRLTQRAESISRELSSKANSNDLNNYVAKQYLNSYYSTSKETVQTITEMTSDLASESFVNEIRRTANSNASTIGNLNKEISSIEQRLNGVQSTVASKASQSQVTQLDNLLTSTVSRVDTIDILEADGNGKTFRNLTSVRYSNSVKAGSLVIRTPLNNTYMTRVAIKGYNYRGSKSDLDLTVSFYRYLNNSFINTSFSNKGNVEVENVRLTNDSQGRAVIIVDIVGNWSYPHISVTEAIVGHSTPPNSMGDNWRAEITNDLSEFNSFTLVTNRMNIQSSITQLEDNINLRVSKNDIINQINISTEGILIDGSKIHITGRTYIENGVIKNSHIQNLVADKITTGTLNAANVNIINLSVHRIVGLDSNFVRTRWNSAAGAGVQIDGDGMVSIAPNGRRVRYGNGSIEFGHRREGFRIRSALDNHSTRNGLIIEPMYFSGAPLELDLYSQLQNTINFGRSQDVDGFEYRVRQVHAGSVFHELKTKLNLFFGTIQSSWQAIMNFQNPTSMQFGLHNTDTGQRSTRVIFNHNGYFQVRGISGLASVHANSFVTSSDRRLKTDIKNTTKDSLYTIDNMRFTEFKRIQEGVQDFGLIAQEVASLDPSLVEVDGEGYLTINSTRLTLINSHAIQQLSTKVDNELKLARQRITALENQVRELKRSA